jgi:hypothetical protein
LGCHFEYEDLVHRLMLLQKRRAIIDQAIQEENKLEEQLQTHKYKTQADMNADSSHPRYLKKKKSVQDNEKSWENLLDLSKIQKAQTNEQSKPVIISKQKPLKIKKPVKEKKQQPASLQKLVNESQRQLSFDKQQKTEWNSKFYSSEDPDSRQVARVQKQQFNTQGTMP